MNNKLDTYDIYAPAVYSGYPKNSQRKLGKLETRFALFYVLKTLEIKSAVSRTESSWDAYMSYLAELMSKAY